mmetsp:Transcript_29219/g.113386  ORF Transcript_29219/g.113386 Transcript_29219/m.113386 type:complete len:94 (+) Transcript_29219:788-1069(+)
MEQKIFAPKSGPSILNGGRAQGEKVSSDRFPLLTEVVPYANSIPQSALTHADLVYINIWAGGLHDHHRRKKRGRGDRLVKKRPVQCCRGIRVR